MNIQILNLWLLKINNANIYCMRFCSSVCLKNMHIIRPSYFPVFLSLIISLSILRGNSVQVLETKFYLNQTDTVIAHWNSWKLSLYNFFYSPPVCIIFHIKIVLEWLAPCLWEHEFLEWVISTNSCFPVF